MPENQSSSLAELFGKRQRELRHQLMKDLTVDKAADVISQFVDTLFEEYRRLERNPRQLQVLGDLNSCVTASPQLMRAADHSTIWRAESNRTISKSAPKINPVRPGQPWPLQILRLGVTLILGTWLFLVVKEDFERALVIAGVFTIIIAQLLEIVYPLIAGLRHSKKQPEVPPTSKSEQHRVSIEVDPDAVIQALKTTLQYADRLLAQVSADPVARADKTELSNSMLDYLHDLASAHVTNDKEYASILAKKVANLLLLYDIFLLTSYEGVNQAKFDVTPALDEEQTETRLTRPAFIQGKNVVRRGEIAVPTTRPNEE